MRNFCFANTAATPNEVSDNTGGVGIDTTMV